MQVELLSFFEYHSRESRNFAKSTNLLKLFHKFEITILMFVLLKRVYFSRNTSREFPREKIREVFSFQFSVVDFRLFFFTLYRAFGRVVPTRG